MFSYLESCFGDLVLSFVTYNSSTQSVVNFSPVLFFIINNLGIWGFLLWLLGFVLIRYVRHTNMEMTVVKEDIFTDSFLEIRGMSCHSRPQWAAPGSVRRQKEYGESRGKIL